MAAGALTPIVKMLGDAEAGTQERALTRTLTLTLTLALTLILTLTLTLTRTLSRIACAPHCAPSRRQGPAPRRRARS